ncbi:hypothetical protein ACFSHP_00245 [Novosphingobium panipatense]
MSDTMIVACPACSTLNRVARERLGAGASAEVRLAAVRRRAGDTHVPEFRRTRRP